MVSFPSLSNLGVPMLKKIISADSHITEPPNCYVDYIDAKFKDRAPRMKRLDGVGDAFVIEGMGRPVPMGLVAAAGKDPSKITTDGVMFEELWRSGWDATCRVADQEKDGVAAEIIYPTVGMVLCNHSDFDFKKACFEAYNRWLQEYCAVAPERLYEMVIQQNVQVTSGRMAAPQDAVQDARVKERSAE